MIHKLTIAFFKTVAASFLLIYFCSCSGSNKNYDYQLAWSNFKIVNINVKDDYKVQNLLLELGVNPIPEYVDIEVFSGYENDNYIRLNDTMKRYSWSELSATSQNYLRGYTGSNKIKTSGF
jgi:hypothetical protein